MKRKRLGNGGRIAAWCPEIQNKITRSWDFRALSLTRFASSKAGGGGGGGDRVGPAVGAVGNGIGHWARRQQTRLVLETAVCCQSVSLSGNSLSVSPSGKIIWVCWAYWMGIREGCINSGKTKGGGSILSAVRTVERLLRLLNCSLYRVF